jgi:hypothetical protein
MVGEVDGWRPWRVIPWIAGGAVSVPIVAGFVLLGAAVVLARSLRDAVRETWALLPAARGGASGHGRSSTDPG